MRRLPFLAILVAAVALAVGASTASAANISWEPAPAYTGTNMTYPTFIGFIPSYQGVNMYCWTTGSPYSTAMGTTSKWFYVRWWAVYHWLYGYVPANFVNNQSAVGHC
jgi:hypothetical protein